MRVTKAVRLKMPMDCCRHYTYSWTSRRICQRTAVLLQEMHAENEGEQPEVNCTFGLIYMKLKLLGKRQ